RSGIAGYTEMLTPWLCSKAEMTVWNHQQVWDRAVEHLCKLRSYGTEPPWQEINQADTSIFNIGNNAQFHTSIWQVARVHSGIVILHDLCLQNLFYEMLAQSRGGPSEYIHLMHRLYGSDGAHAAQRVISGNQDLHSLARLYPLWEALAE